MKSTFALAALLATAAVAPAHAALTVHTSAFLTSVTHYNGFEGIGQNYSFPANTPYTEDTITAEYVGTAIIWTDSQLMEGAYSWYPNGSGTGYTKVTFGPTSAIQFAMGSGWFGGTPVLQYEVLSGGNLIGSGAIAGVSTYTGFGYYGFSGAVFDELRLQVVNPGGGRFDPNANEAGAYDAFSTGTTVPEPATWALMIGGFGMVGFAVRRRSAATAAA